MRSIHLKQDRRDRRRTVVKTARRDGYIDAPCAPACSPSPSRPCCCRPRRRWRGRPDHAAVARSTPGCTARATPWSAAPTSRPSTSHVEDVIDGDASGEGPRILVSVSGPAVDATGIGPGFSGSPIYCPDAAASAQHRRDLGVDRRVRRRRRAGDADRDDPRHPGRRAGRRASAARARRGRAIAAAKPLATPLTVTGVDRTLGPRARARRREGRPARARRARRPARQLPAADRCARARRSASPTRRATCRSARSAPSPTPTPTACGRSATPSRAPARRALLLQDAYVFRVVDNPLGARRLRLHLQARRRSGTTLGTLTNDAVAAVAGRVGALPPTVPMPRHRATTWTPATPRRTAHGGRRDRVGMPEGASPASFVAPLAVTQAASSCCELARPPHRRRVLRGSRCASSKQPVRFCNRYVSVAARRRRTSSAPRTRSARALDRRLDAITPIDDYEGRRRT